MEAQSKIGSMAEHVRHYLETRTKLFVLDAADKTSSTISSIGASIIIGVAMLFVLLFLSVGAAIWIGHAYGETSMGFLFVGLFYLLVTMVLYFSRHSLLKAPIVNSMIKTLCSDEKN